MVSLLVGKVPWLKVWQKELAIYTSTVEPCIEQSPYTVLTTIWWMEI